MIARDCSRTPVRRLFRHPYSQPTVPGSLFEPCLSGPDWFGYRLHEAQRAVSHTFRGLQA